MKYIDAPRWRYVVFVPLLLSLLILGPLTLLTAGCFRGTKLWIDLMDWASYE